MENIIFVINIQIILVLILLGLIIFFWKFQNSFDLEKRITKFSTISISEKQISFFDKLSKKYKNLVNNISKYLIKLDIILKYSKRYDKYSPNQKDKLNRSISIVSNKILISLLAIIITIISDILRGKGISIIQVLLALIIGFFIPDIYLAVQEKRRQKRLENDLLKAVIIMSNAFKAGRSIMQAVEIVSKELDGPISDEFKKMYIDLTYGLDMEVVFERLSNRIKLEETEYMSSSLVILNKTGGNVVKIFNSIEKSFFERKKLNDELKSVTSLSNFVFRILISIPVFIFLMIYIINPMYFSPFITTTIGKFLLIIILIIYVLYILFVKKIIKIKE